ncbi:eukaryotic aspartyl protease [Opisthorchis viverrini]|uniref:Eukaryotic aspartyl protease n=1 Tax=Opisthorchis viverrini TaxID=6198 RepID=A0A1S8WYA0_OPIVI|nr:eukaryotic aspartyl protease [Opisthorchis viverrini]
MYVSTAVHLGSYKQVFQVLLDTNSDISWVPSTETTERTLQRKTQYKKGTSKEYSAHPQPLLIDDDFQSVSGDIAFDRFQVSELIDRPLTKPFQIAGVCMNEFKFGIVTKTKVDPKLPNGVDGVLGLSRKVTYDQFGRTLLESMYAELGIKEEIFALTLCPNDNPELATGHMTFGGLCRDCHKAEFSDFRATTPERWCINFESLRLGIKMLHRGSMTACMDIRHAFIRGPNQLTDAINQQLLGGQYVNGVYQVPCSKRDSYPPVTFVAGRYRLTLTWKQYIIMVSAKIAKTVESSGWHYDSKQL